jgi:hypothetical protein
MKYWTKDTNLREMALLNAVYMYSLSAIDAT